MVEDRAAKNFRSAVKEKMEYKEQRQNARFAYAVSVALVVVVLVIGISTINNYDKMEAVQNSLEALSQSVSSKRPQETKVEERQKSEAPEEAGAQKVPETVETVSKEVQTEGEPKEDTEDTVSNTEESDATTEGDETAEGDAVSDAEGAGGNTGLAADTTDVQSQSGSGEYYIVQKGDTLDKISIKVYGNRGHVDAICRMNGLTDGNLIIIGQKLLLP